MAIYTGPKTTSEALAMASAFAFAGVDHMVSLLRGFNTYARNAADAAQARKRGKESAILTLANQIEAEARAAEKARFMSEAEARYAASNPEPDLPKPITREDLEDLYDAHMAEQEAGKTSAKKKTGAK